MPISLEPIRTRFLLRLKTADGAFERHVVEKNLCYRFDCYAFQEGLLSYLWQSWSRFCREIIIASAQGAHTSSGHRIISPYNGRSEQEIAFISVKLSKGQNIGIIRPLAGKHLEPTWGDATKLNLISTGINTSNSADLASAFGGIKQISDLQTCRNACAHLNSETVARVTNARVRYTDTYLRHPSQMMYWSDPMTNDFAWKSWIEEMELISDFAAM